MANDRPAPSSEAVRARMQRQAVRDTRPELVLRRALFARGLRYRVAYPVPGLPRRSMDIAFPAARLAIFVDGCFWHSCPEHGVSPKSSSAWWGVKLEGNRRRDAETTQHLVAEGWEVLRFWEHEEPSAEVAEILRRLHHLRL